MIGILILLIRVMYSHTQEVVDMLFFLSFLPLLWLIRQWAF